MRGRPLIEWLVFSAIWLALLWPLLALTRSGPPRKAALVVAPGEHRSAWVTLRFSESPESFSLVQGHRTLWSGNASAGAETSTRVELDVFDRRAEVALAAEWPRAGRRAVELVIEPDEWEGQSQTVWLEESRVGKEVSFAW